MHKLISTVAIVAAMAYASGAAAQTTTTTSASGAAGGGADLTSNSVDMGASTSAEAGTSTSVEQGSTSSVEGGASASASGETTTTSGSGGVTITDQQKTEIHTAITQLNVQPVTVDFDVSVGVAVPTTVVLTPLPEQVVTILPQYKGFLFFLLPDGRIVIVDPNSHKIVVIIVV